MSCLARARVFLTMRVEIWSDLACPWCHLGRRRFEIALASFPHRDEVEVVWRAFELDPSAPAVYEGDRVERLARKYGSSREQAERVQRHIAEQGAQDGAEFRFDRVRDGNTFDAHRLTKLAAAHDLADPMNERLFRARFAEGVLLSDHSQLERLAAEVGLPGDEAGNVLAGDRFADEVRADEQRAAELGINAVPFFLADRAIGASGAHPPEILGRLLERGWEARPSAVV
jgi:predicted DsbA family dithiol-disulfide isomerase